MFGCGLCLLQFLCDLDEGCLDGVLIGLHLGYQPLLVRARLREAKCSSVHAFNVCQPILNAQKSLMPLLCRLCSIRIAGHWRLRVKKSLLRVLQFVFHLCEAVANPASGGDLADAQKLEGFGFPDILQELISTSHRQRRALVLLSSQEIVVWRLLDLRLLDQRVQMDIGKTSRPHWKVAYEHFLHGSFQ